MKYPKRNFHYANCSVCGSLFIQRNKSRGYCYEKTCELRHNADRQNRFYHEYKARTGRRPALAARYAADARERASKLDPVIDSIDPYSVFEGAGWICQLCDGPVDPDLKAPAPLSVSLDHIVPMEHGGDHVRSNVRTTHLTCNVSRGNQTRGNAYRNLVPA